MYSIDAMQVSSFLLTFVESQDHRSKSDTIQALKKVESGNLSALTLTSFLPEKKGSQNLPEFLTLFQLFPELTLPSWEGEWVRRWWSVVGNSSVYLEQLHSVLLELWAKYLLQIQPLLQLKCRAGLLVKAQNHQIIIYGKRKLGEFASPSEAKRPLKTCGQGT